MQNDPTGRIAPTGSVSADTLAMMSYDAAKKSMLIAYLLWIFLGLLGGHRFYSGKTSSAIVMLLIFLASISTVLVGVGVVGLALLGLWALIDAFLIPGWVRASNTRLISKLAS